MLFPVLKTNDWLDNAFNDFFDTETFIKPSNFTTCKKNTFSKITFYCGYQSFR